MKIMVLAMIESDAIIYDRIIAKIYFKQAQALNILAYFYLKNLYVMSFPSSSPSLL